mmetsp:Transcript_17004/g.14932  ORF Transcript_17004/g.14932 Transcript_17004/m.14932 type:complete len:202 (-) Transcript_17004:21-626(-)
MDGFHLYRKELDQLESINKSTIEEELKVEGHYYRGAYWTFNSKSFLERLLQVKDPDTNIINFPSFDHAVKDPEEDTVVISKISEESKENLPTIIIAEGLYLLLKESPKETTYKGAIPDKDKHLENWAKISDLFDYKIFIDSDLKNSMERVLKRNMAAIGFDKEFCEKRVKEVDRDNALLVIQNQNNADEIVKFQHDPSRLL